jgi:hypothetical protein
VEYIHKSFKILNSRDKHRTFLETGEKLFTFCSARFLEINFLDSNVAVNEQRCPLSAFPGLRTVSQLGVARDMKNYFKGSSVWKEGWQTLAESDVLPALN